MKDGSDFDAKSLRKNAALAPSGLRAASLPTFSKPRSSRDADRQSFPKKPTAKQIPMFMTSAMPNRWPYGIP